MKRSARLGAAVLLTLTLAVGGAKLALRGVRARQEVLSRENALEQAGLPEPALPPEEEPELPWKEDEVEGGVEDGVEDGETLRLSGIDLDALRAVNPQVVGWISIPGTAIDYPLVRGEDNQYYLNHSWDGRASAAGAIFMECQNDPGFSDFSTILYGHYMGDGTMFNALREYGEQDFLEAHPRVYLALEDGVAVYGVFAALRVAVTDPVYWLDISEESHKEALIRFCREGSWAESALPVGTEDRLLLLSTCVGLAPSEERWVVAAVELGKVPRGAGGEPA